MIANIGKLGRLRHIELWPQELEGRFLVTDTSSRLHVAEFIGIFGIPDKEIVDIEDGNTVSLERYIVPESDEGLYRFMGCRALIFRDIRYDEVPGDRQIDNFRELGPVNTGLPKPTEIAARSSH